MKISIPNSHVCESEREREIQPKFQVTKINQLICYLVLPMSHWTLYVSLKITPPENKGFSVNFPLSLMKSFYAISFSKF